MFCESRILSELIVEKREINLSLAKRQKQILQEGSVQDNIHPSQTDEVYLGSKCLRQNL